MCRLAPEAAARINICWSAVGRASARVHQYDIERLQLMAACANLRRQLGRCHDMTIRKIPEIQLKPRTIKPIQRNFVDGPRAFAVIHAGCEMPRRVHMCSVVRAHRQQFNCPSLTAGQPMRFESWKHSEHSGERLSVIEILDFGPEPRRIGCNGILKRPRQVYQFHAFYRTTRVERSTSL